MSEDLQSAQAVLDLSTKYSSIVKPCAGAHPLPGGKQSVTRDQLEEIRAFVSQNHERLVGIGECGLDFQPWVVKDPSNKDTQRWVLEQQIRLSR